MTERMISNRIRKLKELENQRAELDKQIEALKDEIKEDMDSKGLEEQKVGDYVVRFITVVTNRFDSSRLKKEHADLYSRYLKETSCRRFTVA